jgi:hypothetical protein
MGSKVPRESTSWVPTSVVSPFAPVTCVASWMGEKESENVELNVPEGDNVAAISGSPLDLGVTHR